MFILEKFTRDAWAKYRGFLYQANVSILEWLKLQGETKIQLEYGEDLDLINKIENQRLLVQVKHRENNITLNSPEVMEAIINFLNHLNVNPKMELKYEFYTNTSLGEETPSIYNKKGFQIKKGLEMWNKIYNGTLESAHEEKAIQAILNNLNQKEEFKKVFKNKSTNDFKKIIKQMQWKHDETSFLESANKIQEILEQLGHGTNDSDYEKVYYALLYSILNTLSTKGEKYLSKKELNQEIFKSAQRDMDAIKFNLSERIENEHNKIEQTQKNINIQLKNMGRILDELDAILIGGDFSSTADNFLNTFLNGTLGTNLYDKTLQIYDKVLEIQQANKDCERKFETEVTPLLQQYKNVVENYRNQILKGK